MRFRLSTAAEADLAGIRTFTRERWGREQWLAYRADLVAAFERIAEPDLGRRRDPFRAGDTVSVLRGWCGWSWTAG